MRRAVSAWVLHRSGLTAVRPQLLKYDIDMNAQVRLSAPIKLRAPPEAEEKKRRRDAQAVPSAAAFDVARLFVGPPLLTIALDNLQVRRRSGMDRGTPVN